MVGIQMERNMNSRDACGDMSLGDMELGRNIMKQVKHSSRGPTKGLGFRV